MTLVLKWATKPLLWNMTWRTRPNSEAAWRMFHHQTGEWSYDPPFWKKILNSYLRKCFSELGDPFEFWILGFKFKRISKLMPGSLSSFWWCWKVSLILWLMFNFQYWTWSSTGYLDLQEKNQWHCRASRVLLWSVFRCWQMFLWACSIIEAFLNEKLDKLSYSA